MVTMTYPPDQRKNRAHGGGSGVGTAGSRRSRDAALEGADCRRHGFILTDKTLGTGAYAKVRLARVGEKKLERSPKLRMDLKEKGHDMVAIKVISKKDAPSEYISKFMPREIDALRVTYKHPHLIQLYEVFRSDSRIYLVMEYAPNGDILSYINECVLETGCAVKEDTARRLFKHIISGVSHCHQLNVVHRDLKCENILLDENDNVKISDFGFACRFPTNRCNMLSTFCGSYAYAAPEILSAKNYDGKLADVWSLGVVLYAMVNGRLPFNDQNLNTLLEQTRRKLNFQPWVSAECSDLIRKLLRTRPLTRLRMHEIISHPWVRKNLNIKNMTPFPSSQAFLKVIQECCDKNNKGSKENTKRDKPKEPTLVLKPNGETVRFDSKDKKSNKAKEENQTTKLHPQSQTGLKVTFSPLRPNLKSPNLEPTPRPVSRSPQSKPATTRTADSSRIRNLYRRILKPSLGTEYVFEVVENEKEKEQLIERGLQINTRGKPSPPKTPRLGVKRMTRASSSSATPPHEAISSPSPRLRPTKVNTPNKSKSDTTDDTDSLAGYTATLIPVNIKEKTYVWTRGGTPERESRTRISYRLGLSPTPTPAGHADVKISPSNRRNSKSEPANIKTGKPKASDFINVHGKTQLWKQALRGTLQRDSVKVKPDLRLESPSPRTSPVTPLSPGGGGSSKYKAKLRLLARRNLLHSIMLKPDPEVRTSELLNQLQNNLPILNDVAA